MAWNTRDWEPEDKSWEVTDENVDDEFDDNQLARLGIDLPAFAKEPERVRMPERPETPHLDDLMNQWARMINERTDELPEQLREIMNGLADIQPIGIDPEIAGFDDADEQVEDVVDDVCVRCGVDYYECECDDIYGDEYCQGCGEHLSHGCDCEY